MYIIRIIKQVSKVPFDRQRLIYRGKLLKDADLLRIYKISDLDVIHLVAKTGTETITNNSQQEEQAMNNDSNATRVRDHSFSNIINRFFNTENSSTENVSFPNSLGSNNTMLGRRSRRREESAGNYLFLKYRIQCN